MNVDVADGLLLNVRDMDITDRSWSCPATSNVTSTATTSAS